MRKFKRIGRKVLAYALTACVTASLFTGIAVNSKIQDVSAATVGFTQNDFLKCDGTYIKNNYGKGSNVYLRGTNAGGWLVQESWMNASNIRDQKNLMSDLKNRFGEDKMYDLLNVYESNYWTESDFDNCKNLGMSVIRLPFTYMNLYRYDSSKNDWVLRNDAFNRLDWFVNECNKRGIYVILDLHGAFGSQNGQDHSGEVIDNVSDVTFFSNDYNKNKTLELWRTVASHYAGNPAVAGYDTLNEPGEKAGTTGSKHWAFYDQMYKTIRSVDSDHIIIMESCWGTSNLPNPKNYGWENVVYEYHHYTWNYVSDLAGQKSSCDSLISSINSANYGVPTYIGEYTSFAVEDAWNYVMDKFNKAGWHYTTWSYKTTNSGSWGIYNENSTEKVNPTSDSESEIRRKWGASSVGTGAQSSSGMIYRVIKSAMPGTAVLADKALTDASYFSIKASVNNKFVCAEDYGESALIANRDSGGEWEQFRVVNNSDGTVSFQSRSNNRYLCAVFDDTDKENPILPRSNAIGTWEKFYLEKQSDGTYALRTYVNNYYVQADTQDSKSGILHACASSVGASEKFTFQAVSDSSALPGAGEQQTTQAPTTKAPETQAPEQNVKCPGSFAIDACSSKSSEIEFTTGEGVYHAGKLVANSYLEYKVNVDKAGKYNLSLDLATTSSGRNITISVDGAQVGTMSPAAAASWFTFEAYKVTLSFASKGIHTVRVTASGSCNIANPSFEEYEEEVNVDVPSTAGKYGNNFKAVAYYPNWYGDYTSSVQWDKLTHVNYSFALPNANGTLDSVAGSANVINTMISAAHAHDVKAILAVGGWSYTDGSQCQYVFEKATSTDAKCQSLANSILSVVDQYGFDGVDIDWEYPTASSANQFTTFMRYLRNGLTQRGMSLSSAVAATSGAYQTDEVLSMVDWINVMAYDGDGGAGHSPYSLIVNSFNYWNGTRKVPANKVVLGVPFYERPNWASYADIVAKDANNAYKDSAVINGTTVYYNGLTTMSNKATYAAQNAGGIMIWEISQDSKNANLSLLNAIYTAATAVVGTGGKATVTEVPGTVKVDSYGDKTSSITIDKSTSVTYAGNLNNGSYLDYYIKVPSKGAYTINLNLAAGDTQYNAKDVVVKLNDQAVATVPITASSSWTTFVGHTATINFAAKGTYKLTLMTEGGACNVADFAITKNAEQATTEAPTKAPETEAPTTKAPETEAPTTKAPETEVPTTKPSQGADPIEVFGVVLTDKGDNSFSVVWGQNQDQIDLGQKYNVYVDGVKKLSNVDCGEYLVTDVKAGNRTVRVSAVLNGKETEGATLNVVVTGNGSQEETTTDGNIKLSDKVTINGYQISATAKGMRTVYSVESTIDGKNVEEKGLVYSLSDYAAKNEVYVGSTNKYVMNFLATDNGVLSKNFSNSETATSYAMTMKFSAFTPAEYSAKWCVRAYAKLSDGTYVYSDAVEYTAYDIADRLYQGKLMSNYVAHNYLYTDILTVVNKDYAPVEYNWNSGIVGAE